MRWLLIILLMCNGIYYVWQGHLVTQDEVNQKAVSDSLPENAAPLVLLKEHVTNNKVGTVESTPGLLDESLAVQGITERQAPSEPAICWMIGPFKEVVSGKQVAGRMAALDITLQLKELVVQGKPDYWVHLPPQSTRKLALKRLRELQSKKIDSFLITEGELANGISLGFFTSKKRAEAVYKKRKKQGYGAEIKVVPRSHTEIWLVSDQLESEKISDQLWEKIKEGNQGVERQKNYCKTIASIEKLE